LGEQTKIVREQMLGCIDGIECWHSRSDKATTEHYIAFSRKHDLLMTGGSDCHQKPILMGTVEMAGWAVEEL
jgi:predicted metal-dependent phosphoesterase TrpH